MRFRALTLPFASLALTAVACFAIAGCAADATVAPEGDDAENEDVAVSADEISARSAQFVGTYSWNAASSGDFVDFQELALRRNGTYTAKVEATLVNPGVRCIAFPCTLRESGTWTTVRSGGKLRVKVDPYGAKPTRSYIASIAAPTRTLTLTRFGRTTQLFTSAPTLTCATVLCAPDTHCEMKANDSGVVGPVCVSDAPAACKRTGCSGHVCADTDVITTCEFRPEYACYQAATCARQADGSCGFTKTPALEACLAGE